MSKANKRHETSGYCQETIEKEIALMKCYLPAGDWCRIDKTTNKVVMTYLLQTWNYSCEELGTFPWGMKDTISFMLSDKTCRNKFVLPSLIKNQIENKKYNQDLMKDSVINAGPHPPREYYRLFCQTYESDPEVLKAFLKILHFLYQNQLTLIQNFDSLKIYV